MLRFSPLLGVPILAAIAILLSSAQAIGPELGSQAFGHPQKIKESGRIHRCPVGFELAGKVCTKWLFAEPKHVCGFGATLSHGKCVRFVKKLLECPVGFRETEKGICIHTKTLEPEIFCPPTFAIVGKGACARQLEGPSRKLCPTGSLEKGDTCVRLAPEPPKYICSPDFQQIGRQCIREELYDCTPIRGPRDQQNPSYLQHPNLVAGAPPSNYVPAGATGPGSQRPFPNGKDSTNLYLIPKPPTVVEEYVVTKTCKRTITEAARPICPERARLEDGKVCIVEIPIQHVIKKGETRTESIPPLLRCPGNAVLGPLHDVCVANEEIPANAVCPPHTIDNGQHCGVAFDPQVVCPGGFIVEGKKCTQRLTEPPLTEFTATYACIGKNCDQQGGPF